MTDAPGPGASAWRKPREAAGSAGHEVQEESGPVDQTSESSSVSTLAVLGILPSAESSPTKPGVSSVACSTRLPLAVSG